MSQLLPKIRTNFALVSELLFGLQSEKFEKLSRISRISSLISISFTLFLCVLALGIEKSHSAEIYSLSGPGGPQLTPHIQTRAFTVNEGDPIVFVLGTFGFSRSAANNVKVMATETSSSGTNIFTNNRETTTEFHVPIAGGDISYEIPTRIDYSSTSDGSVRIQILATANVYGVSTVYNTLDYTVKNITLDKPEVSIVPLQSPVFTQDEPAKFVVSISPPQPDDFTITVGVSEDTTETGYLGESAGNKMVKINGGEYSAELSVMTANKSGSGVGTITAAIQAMTSAYTIDTQNNSASVKVNGRGVTKLSVRAKDGSNEVGQIEIVEGGSADIVIKSASTSTSAIDFKIRVSESTGGSDILAPALETEVDLSISASNSGSTGSGVIHTIQTRTDIVSSASSSITVTLVPGEMYEESAGMGTATIIVIDPPAISISKVEDTVKGPSAARFYITTEYELPFDLEVTVNVTGPTSVLNETAGDKTVTISAYNRSKILSVMTKTVSSSTTGIITAEVKTNTKMLYTLGAVQRDSITVNNNDLPLVEISTTNSNQMATEGIDSNLTFRVSSNGNSSVLEVKAIITESGDVIASTNEKEYEVEFAISQSATTMDFTVPIIDDEIDEMDSRVWATLVSDSAYRINGSNSQAYVDVLDDELPAVSITPIECTEDIDQCWVFETDNVMFRITVIKLPGTSINVNVRFTQSGLVTFDKLGTRTISFSSSQSSRIVTLTIIDDSIEENTENGINARVVANSSYQIVAGTASVQVRDNDGTKPVISLERRSESTPERTDARFFVRVWPTQTTDLEFGYMIEETNNAFYDESQDFSLTTENTATITRNTTSLELAIPTDLIDTSMGNGSIKVTIVAKTTYDILINSRTIAIIDDEKPLISISTTSETVAEGVNIEFSVTLAPAPTSPYPVSITVSENQGANILNSPTQIHTVNFTSSNTTETITTVTKMNNVDNLGGMVTASINVDPSYHRVGTGEVIVTVTDTDDPPVISISPIRAVVIEDGDGIELTLSTDETISSNLVTIELEISEGNSNIIFAEDSPFTQMVELPALANMVKHTITPQGDDIAELEGEFTVTILPDITNMTYSSAGSPNNVAVIAFIDDDYSNLPLLTITSGGEVQEADDTSLEFNLMVNQNDSTSLDINYRLSEKGGDFLSVEPYDPNEVFEHSATFMNGQSKISFGIENDENIDAAGLIEVTLVLSDSGTYTYRIDKANASAIGIVRDDDGGGVLPQVNVTAGPDVNPSEPAEFSLIVEGIFSSALSVEIRITHTGDFFVEDSGIKTVEIPTNGTATYTEETKVSPTGLTQGDVTLEIQPDSAELLTYSFGKKL